MVQKRLRVELLAYTPDGLSLIYTAFRQCYHSDYVAEMWPKLLTGEITLDKQAEFVAKTMESGHNSPVEHVNFTFAADGISRALTHQLVRHRIASYSQQSQRYLDGKHFEYVLPPAIARIPEAKARFLAFLKECRSAYSDLQGMLEAAGRGAKANEDARFVLPQASGTKIVFTMNCRSLLHFFELRCCARAQWEIRALAQRMLELCREALPTIFDRAGARCERLGYCPEGERFTCGRYPLRTIIV
ncbi:Flavin-dependent thymidylate synthase [Desulfovibrionales bacterium]